MKQYLYCVLLGAEERLIFFILRWAFFLLDLSFTSQQCFLHTFAIRFYKMLDVKSKKKQQIENPNKENKKNK